MSLYTMLPSFSWANCISRHWGSLVIFLTWVVNSKKDLSPLPLYVCKPAKKWSFFYWACNSGYLEIRAFVSLCRACHWLNTSITNWSVLLVVIVQLKVAAFCKWFMQGLWFTKWVLYSTGCPYPFARFCQFCVFGKCRVQTCACLKTVMLAQE